MIQGILKVLKKGVVTAFIFFILVTSSLLLFTSSTDVMGADQELPLIKGRVVDKDTLKGYENFTLVFHRENLIPIKSVTDEAGAYNQTLPPGHYTLKVYSRGGEESGILVDQRYLNITWDPVHYYDILIDPDSMVRSHVTGFIIDEDWEEPLEGCDIYLINKRNGLLNSTRSTKNGSFSIYSFPGDYLLIIKYDDEERYNRSIMLDWGKDWKSNITIQGKGDRPLVNLNDIRDFLVDHWKDIIGLLLVILAILLAYLLLSYVVNYLKKKYKLVEADWFTAIQHFLNRLTILSSIILITFQLNKMFDPVKEYIWSWMSKVAFPITGILMSLLFSRLLLLGNARLWDYVRKKRGQDDKKLLSGQIISLLEIVLRYLIFTISAAVILVLILYALGLRQEISSRISGFLSDNAGRLGFLIILVVMAVLLKRFIDIFFKELKTRSTKVNPQIMTMTHKGTTGLVYFIISLIFLFTLLSMGGLGEIGQSLILVISMIVGLVVSFAATGSIGNLLSGMVLMSMRPFNVEDRVEISNIIGDVAKIGIMFTTLRDLDGKLHEIPNNNVLMGTITNYTRSVDEGGLAVVIDVSLGYDINPKRARALMKRAALASPGVLKDKTPRVIVRKFLDHAVEYRLRAYIDDPSNMIHIRSSVMESMLYAFHTEGLEILSPLFHVKRESVAPTEDELHCRTNDEECVKESESAAEGLTMFDSLPDE